ncbi:hypothetical protein Tco_0628941 [Tanacetum coccineum]|uniref:Uncharacterized protein n=1 Tax=Tanacetum coccineum TaxID=301880 RepID=A0ABQ4WRQ2_9ASTR
MVPFIKEPGYTGKYDMLSEIHTDHMHQPWRTFDAIINRCISRKSTGLDRLRPSRAQILWGMFYQKNVDYVTLLWEDFMFQADNREISSTRKENMPYPRFTKVVISHFISKDKTISMRNRINLHTIQDDSLLAIKDSKAYKIYLAYAIRAATPKKVRKFKKPASPSKKKTLVTVEEEEPEPAKKDKPTKKLATKRKVSGVQIRDTPALLEKAQLKKALRRCKRETTILQEGGSSEGANFNSEVPDESKVSDSNDDDSDNDGKNVEDDDDHEQADDERTKSDDDEEEKQDDEFTHTPDDYIPINDETNDESREFDEEEYEELYGDVNISLKDAEPANKEKGPIISSSISSDYVTKYLNFDNIPSIDTKVVSMLDINVQHEDPCTSPLLTIPVFVIQEHTIINPPEIVTTASSTTISSLLITNLEKDVKELKTVDHSIALLSTIKSEVPNAVKEYLGTSLDDALHKVLKKHSADITKEHFIPAKIVERLRQQYVPEKITKDIRKIKIEHIKKQQEPKETITSSDTTALIEFDQKTILFETMTKSKSFNKSPKQRALYHPLIESILEDEDAIDEGVAVKLKKMKQDDADKDEGPSAGSNQSSSKKYTTSTTKTKADKYDILGIEDMVPSLWSPIKVSKYDVYSTNRIIAVTRVKVTKWYDYGYLEEIEVRRKDQQLYKFKEGDFPRLHMHDIEDILLLFVQKKLSNLERDVIFDLGVALRMFTRHISNRTPYIAYNNPQGIIYIDKYKRNMLMRSDELYKFSDGTLTSIGSVLHRIASNMRMDYLPKRR